MKKFFRLLGLGLGVLLVSACTLTVSTDMKGNEKVKTDTDAAVEEKKDEAVKEEPKKEEAKEETVQEEPSTEEPQEMPEEEVQPVAPDEGAETSAAEEKKTEDAGGDGGAIQVETEVEAEAGGAEEAQASSAS